MEPITDNAPITIPLTDRRPLGPFPKRIIRLWSRQGATNDLTGGFRRNTTGSGLHFRELREYTPGDEIKHIHWSASARSGKTYVKTYDEERALRIHIALDISASSLVLNRFRIYQELTALLLWAAHRSRDSIGLSFFSTDSHEFFPQSSSPIEYRRMSRAVAGISELYRGTDLRKHIQLLQNKLRRKTIIFLISDFFSDSFEIELRRLSSRHNVVLATSEEAPSFPEAGIISVYDPESGASDTLDSSDPIARNAIASRYAAHVDELYALAARVSASMLPIGRSALESVMQFSSRVHG